MKLRLLKVIIFSFLISFLFPSLTFSQSIQNRHPLRPKPNELTSWEKNRPKADYTQTLFCAQRPTAVQNQEFLKTDDKLTLQISGTYISNFEEFITPLLSITNKTKDDYNLSFEEKAQQYLADYLGGRAYYEIKAEDPNGQTIASRLGVFRKLAPKDLQDKYKRAMIYRATGIPDAENPNKLDPMDFLTDYYDFEPASPTVANYPVTCFRNNEIVSFTQYNDFKNPCGNSENIRLSSFNQTNWAPIPEEFENNKDYQNAYNNWYVQDGGQIIYALDCDPQQTQNCPIINRQPGKWAKAWPYVPMFSREDLQGYIRAVSSNAQPQINPVKHPHLARTYELSSALSTFLMPQSYFDYNSEPDFKVETPWSGKPWCKLGDLTCKNYWIDSSDSMPDLALGGVCDPQTTIITSSGDSAYDKLFTTQVNSPKQIIDNPEYSKATERKCNLLERNDPIAYEKECKFKRDVRYSPDYFVTRTPYLNQITNRLVSEQGIFNILRTKQDVDNNQLVNWPAIGNPEEATPIYSFISGGAEAGMMQPGILVEFYYKSLGFVHCQKEKVLSLFQPFVTGEPYKYLSPKCAQDSTGPDTGQPGQPGQPGKIYVDKELYGPPPNVPSESTCSQGVDSTGRWLKWPYKSSSSPPVTSCYKDPSRNSCHAGIDMDPGDNASIYPGAPGKIHYANGAPKGCAEFGACVIIDHCNGWFTIYAHLQEFTDGKFINQGQSVTTSTQIGIQGNTGRSTAEHLHFGLAWGGSIPSFWYSHKKTANVCTYTNGCSCTSGTSCR